MGIENIKIILLFIFTGFGNALKMDQNSDGKISWREALSVFMPLAFDYERISAAIPELKNEFTDLTPDELDELVQFTKDNLALDFDHDELEFIIETVIEALATNYRFVLQVKEMLAAKKLNA